MKICWWNFPMWKKVAIKSIASCAKQIDINISNIRQFNQEKTNLEAEIYSLKKQVARLEGLLNPPCITRTATKRASKV